MKTRKKKIKIRDGKSSELDEAAAEAAAGSTDADSFTPRPGNGETVADDASARQVGDDGSGAADRVATLETRVTELEDSVLRAKADFQNLQRRAGVERAEAVRYGNAELMRSLLGVIDDFERSLAAAESPENQGAFAEGVRLIHANMVKALSDHGLERIEALHERFDPNIHEALMRQPSDEHEPGTVVEQIARGYRLRDRVVRPAKVIVAAEPQAPADTEDDSAGDSRSDGGTPDS